MTACSRSAAAALVPLALLLYTSSARTQTTDQEQPPTPVRNPANNHYYEIVVLQAPISWHEANEAARSSIYKGMTGYLATITSAREAAFISQSVYPTVTMPDWYSVWVGGYKQASNTKPASGWRWVTGEPWNYTFWRQDEPNNYDSRENRLCLDSTRFWNDLADAPHRVQHPNPIYVQAYLIEYGKVTLPSKLKPRRRSR